MLALEEERAQVLGRVEQLKVRVKELEQQLQESAREVRARALGGTLPRLSDNPKRGLSCPEWP